MPEETPTLTPTATLTPTVTLTPTLEFIQVVPVGDHYGAHIERTVTAGDFVIILLLFSVLLSMWGMYVLSRLGNKND